MATFGWSYKSNVSGTKRPKELKRKVEDWQKDREDVKVPLHRQTHSAESVNAGLKRRRYHPRAKIFVGSLNKDTKPVTLAEYFSFFGEIAYMKMVKDKETGLSRGFAFITFVEVDEAEKAVRWCKGNHPRVDGKEIRVGFAERRFGPVPKRTSLSRDDTSKETSDSQTLYWEYKWSEDPHSEVYGPYETSLMLQWYNMGYFSEGCWVRQVHHTAISNATTQELQHEDKNLPTVPSLVDAYSSSSDDEDDEQNQTKLMQYRDGGSLQNNEMVQNSEDNQKDGLTDKRINSGKLFDRELERKAIVDRKINETDKDSFQNRSTNDQSVCENSEKTISINEKSQHNKEKDKSIIGNCEAISNKILMQNINENDKDTIENNQQETIEKRHLFNFSQRNNATSDERTNESNTQCKDFSKYPHDSKIIENNKQTNEERENLQNKVDASKTTNQDCAQEDNSLHKFIYSDQIHNENSKCTNEEVEKVYSNDHELVVMDKNQDVDEMDSVQPFSIKDQNGFRARDMFGRDSSSEDEDYEDYFDQQSSDNEFVHISEIDFSMFP